MLQGRKVAAGCHDEVKCLLVMLPLSRPRVRSLKYELLMFSAIMMGNKKFDK